MKTRTSLVTVASICGLYLTVQCGFAQGSLTPPGVPAPAMKTLEQIEPRTPISSLPYDITNSGSYFLTTNLTGISGTNGITIACGDVTLDLRGFTLLGVPGSLDGIYVSSSYGNVTVENGAIDSWGSLGIDANNVAGGQFIQLNIVNNGSDGLDPGRAGQVRNCIASGNAGDGFGGFDSNIKYDACTGTGNDGHGFSTFEGCSMLGCSANLNGLDGFVCFVHNTLRDSVAHDNSFDGIDMPYSGGGGLVAGCVCNNNGNEGIIMANGYTVQNSVAEGNGMNGIAAGAFCSVLSCTVETNNQDGITVDTNSLVTACTANENVNNGIQASGGCLIENNTCSGNGSGNTTDGGILCTGSFNRVDGNHLTVNNPSGLYLGAVSNTVVRNSAKSNTTTNYFIGSGNDVGPVGSAATSTSPGANLQ
jgi:hypothetical protein